MDTEDFWLIAIAVGLVGLFVWCEIDFAESQTALYDECMAEKKDKWTCQTVVESRQASHDAAIAAGVAIGSATSRR